MLEICKAIRFPFQIGFRGTHQKDRLCIIGGNNMWNPICRVLIEKNSAINTIKYCNFICIHCFMTEKRHCKSIFEVCAVFITKIGSNFITQNRTIWAFHFRHIAQKNLLFSISKKRDNFPVRQNAQLLCSHSILRSFLRLILKTKLPKKMVPLNSSTVLFAYRNQCEQTAEIRRLPL